MGSSPSRSTQVEYTRNQSNRSNYHSSRSPAQPSRSYPQSPSTQRKRHPQNEPEWAEPVQRKRQALDELKWPLPPNQEHPPFEPNDNSDSDRYLLAPISPRNQTPSAPSTPRARAIELYNEKDTSNEDWKKQVDSRTVDSAQVQSQLTATFHACFNLSAADDIDVVMNGLKKTHQDLDDCLKRRLAKVSMEAEQKVGLIVQDTKDEQKRLLAYDKMRQLGQDALYQEWLQKYIVELNKWRSRELAQLQKELSKCQYNIVEISKKKIDRINIQANSLKTQILDEEKNAASRKTKKLTGKMYDLTREDANFLGSESKTELNLRIQSNVGRIAPGQSCTNGV